MSDRHKYQTEDELQLRLIEVSQSPRDGDRGRRQPVKSAFESEWSEEESLPIPAMALH